MTIFTKSKARWALLLRLHEDTLRKIDEQIKVEREFINKLENFFMFEKKMEKERMLWEQKEELEKKALANDMKY